MNLPHVHSYSHRPPRSSKIYLVPTLLLALSAVLSSDSLSQTPSSRFDPIAFPVPLKLELAQHFNPWDPLGRMATESFKLAAGTKLWDMQFSTLPPGGLGGRQFQGMPGGYEIAEFTLKPKWGSIAGFRTTGYSERFVAPANARDLTGATMELPSVFRRTRMSGYFVHGTSADSTKYSAFPSDASQAGFTMTRDLTNKLKLQSEWTQSWESSSDRKRVAGEGFFLNLNGAVGKTQANVVYRVQTEGLANPAIPAQGRARSLLGLDLRRSYRKHQFQYSNQLDSQQPIFMLHVPFADTHQESFQWTYSPKQWPQISAAEIRKYQSSADIQESEDSFRLSANKGLKRITLAIAYMQGSHSTKPAARPVWRQRGILGDVSLEIQKSRRLNVHYESGELSLRAASNCIWSEMLQLNSRLSFLGDKIALTPAFDYRRQQDSRGTLDLSLLNMTITTLFKLPAYMPGSDVLVTINSRRSTTLGHADQTQAGLVVRWNFKRL